MKKTLILSALILSGIFSAQNKEFAKYTTNVELVKLKNTVSAKQKMEFYKQYAQNKLVEDMNRTFTYKKYSKNVLRKFADTILNYDSSRILNDQDKNESIKKLDHLIGLKNKKDEINENLSSLLGEFPAIVKPKDASEHTAYEVVPGEILKIIYWGGGNMTTEMYYQISKDHLKNINVIPENESFIKKVSKNLKNKEVSFYGSKGKSSTDILKDVKSNTYIINASLYLEDDNFAPLYEVKYTTKDFKNFTPTKVRANDEKAKWTIIK